MSVTLRNISGLGEVEVVFVGVVPAGETFTVEDVVGESLARQVDNFEVVEDPNGVTGEPTVPDDAPADVVTDPTTEA